MNKTKSLLAAVALAAVAASAQGQVFNTISGSFSASSLPTGINGTLFYVSSPVTIESLAFVDSGTPGLGGSADVGIYSYIGTPNSGNFNSTAVVSTTISGTGTGTSGNYVWQTVASTLLAPGYYGILATSTTLIGDNVGDSNLGDSIPTFTGAPVATGGVNSIFISDIVSGTFASPVHNASHRYKLVNFGFTPVPVPEPETYAMIAGVGLVAFGLWRRRQ